jgi:hypothetical protein
MNDRIKELAKQCWNERWEGQLHFDNEKFAELIVRECANVAAEHDALDIYEEIREHFGVEE